MTAAIQLNPGTIFGREFRIVKPLSAGGMGAVYIAEQASTNSLRALKLMHPTLLSDPRLRERFEQEARVGALIKSDHVVQVISAGVDQTTGVPWIAMELLEGEDLAACLRRRGSLHPNEVYDIFRQVGHALAAAHAVGVVHRDLKPENIFLSKSRDVTGQSSVKLLDFGIAKVVAEAKTMATAAIGTPLWMAPEQTDPRAPISPSTDIWPLGLIAFLMLTGRVYWKTAGDPLAGMTALMREILLEPLALPSVRAMELGAPGTIPPGFDAWFARCVSREVSQRFPNAAEALEALGPSLFAAGATSRSVAPWPIPAEPPRQKPPIALIAGAIGGLIGVTAAAFSVLNHSSASSTTPTEIEQKPKTAVEVPLDPARSTAPPRTEPTPSLAATPGPTNNAVAAGKPAIAMNARPQSSPTPSSAPTPAPTAGRPFDYAAANAALQRSASTAKFMCQGREGPKVVSATVYFNPVGAVQRTMMDPAVSATASGICVMGALGSTRVPAFDSKELQPVSTVVALQ